MAYSMTTHYAGQGLLDSFSFFTGTDPSHGFVNYQSQTSAEAMGLATIDGNNRVRLGVDSTNTYSVNSTGRPSVRLTSLEGYSHGLFIADFDHMPASTCGTWPAFWMFDNYQNGANWPNGGELDIIEGANTAERNLISAHTIEGCMAPSSGFTGQQGPTNCGPDSENIGCNYAAPTTDTTSYGDSFNAEGGGVYAVEWDSEYLKVWHFPRASIPADIAYAPAQTPDPSSWGPPQALFGGSSCNPDTYFYNMSFVIDINLCGDYAGNVWGVTDQCNQLAPTCTQYVAAHPEAFLSAYWDINYIDVYEKKGGSNPTPSNNSTGPYSNTTSSVPVSSSAPTRTLTLSTASTTPTGTPQGALSDPATIDGFALLGCFSSAGGYLTFEQVADSATMDNEVCVQSCNQAGHRYAGSFDTSCYCADAIGDAVAVANALCNEPCPGNPAETCGGRTSGSATGPVTNTTTNSTLEARFQRRAAPSNILLTLYGDLSAAQAPPGAPAMGNPSGPAISGAPGGKITTVMTVTYTTVCATNPAELVALEYCTTMTLDEDCGCTETASKPAEHTAPAGLITPAAQLATVPMTTCVETCNACGPSGENTVTLTVPTAVANNEVGAVTAVAVQTIVPVNGSFAATGTGAYGAASTQGQTPFVAGAECLSVSETMVWAVMGLMGLFGLMVVL